MFGAKGLQEPHITYTLPCLLQTETLHPKSLGSYLLVCQRVHVADNLCCHLPCVCGAVLEGSLDNRHDKRQGWGINEVNKFGVQQGLQAFLGLPRWVRQGVQQDRGNGCMSKGRFQSVQV